MRQKLVHRNDWEWEVHPEKRDFFRELGEIFHYKDLLLRLVKRDLLVSYQQTIIGPFWILLQPLLTTMVYSLIFSRIAGIPTDGIPPILFYLSGIIIWNYFSDCFTDVMHIFLHNARIFSKVYFPRLIVALSALVTRSIRLGIQLLVFLAVYAYFLFTRQVAAPSVLIWLVPLILALTGLFALGAGLIVSVLTAKYRDLNNVVQFGLRLFMFMTPVVYGASLVASTPYRFLFWLNPLTPAIETFRAAFLKQDAVPAGYMLSAVLLVFSLLLTGIYLFKKQEIKVMDII
ncbi:lipopolysaccharide transport system permease protein [Anseongella ginsenosidimutans]|uniref:Transport permease protein n=1 Tax=Anseongella ginsenosidimutans TaxID=496056 RepID=A0A4V2UUB9_9SPHI|nr:ABC transporter permease [Anseongella ginsenosidimutans]QEC51213.1 ABC transporter permease [Anseongella ginsenosidimutans]TCS90113.1 lipopolysaccharide transport system permease protein [Anseongella ginsenosidimutans]